MKRPPTKPNRRRLRRRTQALRREIAVMDFVTSGTLMTRTKVCGRATSPGATGIAARHGPYYEFNRRQDGRLVHRVIAPELAAHVLQALENHRRVQAVLDEWEQETVEELLTPQPE